MLVCLCVVLLFVLIVLFWFDLRLELCCWVLCDCCYIWFICFDGIGLFVVYCVCFDLWCWIGGCLRVLVNCCSCSCFGFLGLLGVC